LRKFLWDGAFYQHLGVKNHGLEPVAVALSWHFGADFADIFEVRGMKRKRRGVDLPPEVTADRVTLAYRGLDDVVRRTLLQFTPAPARLTANLATLELRLEPQQEATFLLTAGCEREPAR